MTNLKFPNDETKFKTVIEKNTFYFRNVEFEEEHEAYISSLAQNLFILKNRVEQEGLREEIFVDHIMNMEDGLDALLTLTGFSKESLLRLMTFIRVIDDEELNKIVNKEYWPKEDFEREWTLEKIKLYVRSNRKFAEGIVNLFFKGSTVPILRKVIPLFEFKKLDINKLNFSTESLIDTIIRYKTKGSYAASKGNNPEVVIEKILNELRYPFERGKLENIPRTLDFIIPSKSSPKIIIECSYVVTTSSGMGDKAKTEQRVAETIKKHYPNALFIGFVDGIGWYVRRGDLARMVKAYNFVFTFRADEIEEFKKLLTSVMEYRNERIY
ncbi:MAG TPA: hypothetical protein ENI51_05055 [Candidatus Atribacteria bacterium]|nr:hypothetical protein [Candidatus Atribacteria bacterium]